MIVIIVFLLKFKCSIFSLKPERILVVALKLPEEMIKKYETEHAIMMTMSLMKNVKRPRLLSLSMYLHHGADGRQLFYPTGL